jgi:hypothetical protein
MWMQRGQLSSQDYERIAQQQADKDYTVTPRPAPRGRTLTDRDWRRIGQVLSEWVRL